MNFPIQNDFLRPFLSLLTDGVSHSRHDIIQHLITHFGLTEEQISAKSGKHNTLINRVAWCDAHFVKAGFVQKEPHQPDSRFDRFMITPMGLREYQRFADKLTVGYLQSFYLNKVIRGAGADDSVSDAERALSEAFNALGDAWTVIQGARWIGKDVATVGEIDFLVIHRKHGVLVLEVKGGVVAVENGVWTTTTQHGRTYTIQDPCAQAERNRRELRKWLGSLPATKHLKFAIFPAVALPDSVVKTDIRPDFPADICLDMRHVDDIEARLLSIFAYWKNHADAGNAVMDATSAGALVTVFQVTRGFQPQIIEIFKRERKQIEQSTSGQFRILRQLSLHRRATIIGGAGTGKTLIAMEKTQQLLNMGFRVLLVCYNTPLKEWLAGQMTHGNLVVTNFHGLVKQACSWAKISANYSFDQFLELAPDLLLEAGEALQKRAQDYLFDAIIVDEAQDFADTWWIGINELLKDPQGGVLYVFFDDNQRIYQQINNIPMNTTPFVLTDNCRNTQHIHQHMSEYVVNGTPTDCLGPDGRPIEIHPAKNVAEASKQLSAVLANLIQMQGIAPKDVIILTPAGKDRSGWKEGMQIGNYSLTWYLNDENPNGVRVSTIHSYKGLESAVVILTELDKIRQDDLQNSLIYIGISRARHHVVVIGNLPKALK